MNEKVKRKISHLENIDRFSAEELFQYLPLNHSDVVLDIGAGAGYVALPIAERVDLVYALDLDEEILNYLQLTAEKRGITNIQPVIANFKDIPLADDKVDIAIASISLHEVKPLSAVLEEIMRTLKSRGTFLCIDIEKTADARGPRVSSGDMMKAMENAGFSDMKMTVSPQKLGSEPVYIIRAVKK
ncbi:class I SAM-dependent methyltransferase [Cytobacillus kochii]|uniref:class I SAM-dependent methyltransferase n=1 Tax=Cytobacillus kochii TaxID=859143 RepID=UPI0024809C22|nr:class I SAM-dependent methyltransferase [Cytobacillus kochii]